MFNSKKHKAIYNRNRYLVSQESDITHIFSNYFGRIKVDSYDFFPMERILTLHNVIILLKSVLNKDKDHYYYYIFLEKCSYYLAKKKSKIFVLSIMMEKFRERNSKRKVLCQKKAYKTLGR